METKLGFKIVKQLVFTSIVYGVTGSRRNFESGGVFERGSCD
jgi:hypothetical protein